MRRLALAPVLILAAIMAACGGTPLSPSGVRTTANGAVDRAFDGHEPPPAPSPEPGPAPSPEPGPAPMPGPAPEPAPAPAPGAGAAALMVSIVSSFGPGAYLPNPLWDVAVGTTLTWVNEDSRVHHIVLEDGRDLGAIMPGQSSAAVPLTTESTSYQCILHPSMFGTINRMLAPEESPYPEYSFPRRRQR